MGYILKWRRLDALDLYHEPGDPDIEIWVSKDNLLTIIMAECKKPNGGSLRPSQIKCRDKYSKFLNVLYVEIRSSIELKKLIINNYDNYNFNPDLFREFESIEL